MLSTMQYCVCEAVASLKTGLHIVCVTVVMLSINSSSAPEAVLMLSSSCLRARGNDHRAQHVM